MSLLHYICLLMVGLGWYLLLIAQIADVQQSLDAVRTAVAVAMGTPTP